MFIDLFRINVQHAVPSPDAYFQSGHSDLLAALYRHSTVVPPQFYRRSTAVLPEFLNGLTALPRLMWRILPGMAARLVLNHVVQERNSTACTRLGSNRWMVSVRSCLGFVHVDVFWGSVSVNRSSAANDLSVVPVY